MRGSAARRTLVGMADRRSLSFIAAAVLAAAVSLGTAAPADAAAIAGGGFSSSYAGESAFTTVDVGGTGQFSAIFFNSGTQVWLPRVVGLIVCASDKVTCNVPANALFNKNWLSPTVYATVPAIILPGQNAFFTYNFAVPVGTPPSTVTTFYGDVGIIGTGTLLRPEGYFQSNTVPTPPLSLTLAPSAVSLPVGGVQQFKVSGQPFGQPVTWSVTGGCGAITTGGLFAATSMNSVTQPCSVVASAVGWKGTATVTVFGSASQLSCSATPATIAADGGATTNGVATAKISLRDQNGNVVSNASSPQVSVVNVTPSLATVNPIGSISPSNGVVTVTITSTTSAGDIQVSASAPGFTGCNAIVRSSPAGPAVKTVATLSTGPIAADGLSMSTLQVDVADANGTRVLADNVTQIGVTVTSGVS